MITLAQALEKAAKKFDEVAASHLINTETMLRHHGADAEELAIELARVRAQHTADRQRLLATVIAVFYSWRAEEPWEAPGSAQVH